MSSRRGMVAWTGFWIGAVGALCIAWVTIALELNVGIAVAAIVMWEILSMIIAETLVP